MYSLDYVTIEVQRLERAIKNEQEHCRHITNNIVSQKDEISFMKNKIQQSKTREEEVLNKIKRLNDSIIANRSSVMMVEELRCDFVKQCHAESIKISDDKKRFDTIISKYENKWEEYHKIYKTFPLFKELQNTRKTFKLKELCLLHHVQQIFESKQKVEQIINIKNKQVNTKVLKFVMLLKELNEKNAERSRLQKEVEHLNLVKSNLLCKKAILEEKKKKELMQQNMIKITEAGSDNKNIRRRKLPSCEQNFEFGSIFDLPSLESPPAKIIHPTKDLSNSFVGVTDILSFNWLSFVANKKLSNANLPNVASNSMSQIPEQSVVSNSNESHCDEEELTPVVTEHEVEHVTLTETIKETVNFEDRPMVNETSAEKEFSGDLMDTLVEEISDNQQSEETSVCESNATNTSSAIDKINETENVSMETTENVNRNQISTASLVNERERVVEQFSMAESLLSLTSTSVTPKTNSHRDSGYMSFIEEQSDMMSQEYEQCNPNKVSEIVAPDSTIVINIDAHDKQKENISPFDDNRKDDENVYLCAKVSAISDDNQHKDKTAENSSVNQGSLAYATLTSQTSIVNESNNDIEQNTFLSPQEVFRNQNILPFRQNYSNFEMSPDNTSNDSPIADQFVLSPPAESDNFWTNPVEEAAPGFSFSSFNIDSNQSTSAFGFSFGSGIDGKQDNRQDQSGGFSFGF